MNFIWNNFEINGIKENKNLLVHLNLLEFTFSKVKKDLTTEIILKNIGNFKNFIYERGKISINNTNIITNKIGLENLPNENY